MWVEEGDLGLKGIEGCNEIGGGWVKIIKETEILFGQIFLKRSGNLLQGKSIHNWLEHLVGVSESTIKLNISIFVHLKFSS